MEMTALCGAEPSTAIPLEAYERILQRLLASPHLEA